MAIGFDELLQNLEKYKKFLLPNEKIVFPRLEAKRRIANKEKRTRVQFDCDPETYKQYWEQLARFREIVGNTTVAHTIICDILAKVPEDMIRAIAEERADTEHVMGRDTTEAE